MAQLASAQRSGRWGRRFKSGYPDHIKIKVKKMPNLYGVNTDKPYSAYDVKNALVRCFIEAHREAQQKEIADITSGMSESSADKLTKANIEIIIRNAFKKIGGNFDNPTKESIIKVMDVLKDFSKRYRSPEVISKHYGELLGLVNGLEEEQKK